MTDEAVVVEQFVRASPRTVFSFFSDTARWLRWQGVEATIEPRPGGELRMRMADGGFASGQFLEVVPSERIVFTWGWENADHGLSPGSSTVEVELMPLDDGTLVRLTHRHLPALAQESHAQGWSYYLKRLAVVCEGGDPGRVP